MLSSSWLTVVPALIICITVVLLSAPPCHSFSLKHQEPSSKEESSSLPLETSTTDSNQNGFFSRRDLLFKAPIGVVATYGYGRLFYNALSVQGIRYPSEHEDRVVATIRTALAAGAASRREHDRYSSPRTTTDTTCYRILEVGIGADCRVARRGLYESGLQALAQNWPQVQTVQVTGIDLQLPKPQTLAEAQRRLNTMKASGNVSGRNDLSTASSSTGTPPPVNLLVTKGDITTLSSLNINNNFPDGYFDTILCFFTLCSVTDQQAALHEMKRLLRPNGGTLGYVEHVAVNPITDDSSASSSRSFLEQQQIFLDPLQQRVADNCHLHRYTEEAIRSAFGIADSDENNSNNHESRPSSVARFLETERFFVDNMWPVSCQCRGVVQTTGISV